MTNSDFPFRHIVLHDEEKVLLMCDSAIAAMAIPVLMKKHFPQYKAEIVSEERFEAQRHKHSD